MAQTAVRSDCRLASISCTAVRNTRYSVARPLETGSRSTRWKRDTPRRVTAALGLYHFVQSPIRPHVASRRGSGAIDPIATERSFPDVVTFFSSYCGNEEIKGASLGAVGSGGPASD